MSRIARFAVLVAALMSLFAVLSSSAGAVTWHNTGNTAFTATGGAGTLTSTAVTLGCTGSSATGTAPASFVGATYSISGTETFSGCTLSGQAVAMDCGYTFTGTTWTSGTPAVTSGNMDMTCGVYLAGTKLCHISASAGSHVTNPVRGTAVGMYVTTHSTATASNGPVGSCPLGNGDRGHWSQLLKTVTTGTGGTGTRGPIITRTA